MVSHGTHYCASGTCLHQACLLYTPDIPSPPCGDPCLRVAVLGCLDGHLPISHPTPNLLHACLPTGALPAIPGLAGPSSSAAVQADVDAFLRGAAAGPPHQQQQLGALPEFQEFESIYGGLGRAGPPLPGAAAAAAPGRLELGHFLQVLHLPCCSVAGI